MPSADSSVRNQRQKDDVLNRSFQLLRNPFLLSKYFHPWSLVFHGNHLGPQQRTFEPSVWKNRRLRHNQAPTILGPIHCVLEQIQDDRRRSFVFGIDVPLHPHRCEVLRRASSDRTHRWWLRYLHWRDPCLLPLKTSRNVLPSAKKEKHYVEKSQSLVIHTINKLK